MTSRKYISHLFALVILMISAAGIHAQTFLICHSNGDIYEVDPANCTATLVVATTLYPVDMAINPNNPDIVYIITGDGNLLSLDLQSGNYALISVEPFVSTMNSLVYGEGDELYMASSSSYNLFKYSLTTGLWTDLGYIGATAGGDLTFFNGYLYMATSSGGLLRIDTETMTHDFIGPMFASDDIYGIITYSPNAYCDGVASTGLIATGLSALYSVDPETGVGTPICEQLAPPLYINGAASITETNIDFVPIAINLVTSDSEICEGEMIEFSVANASDFNSFEWSNGQQTASISMQAEEDVTVFLNAVTTNDCDVSASASVIVHAAPEISFLTQTISCPDMCDASISATISTDSDYTIDWSNENNVLSNANLCPGTYTLIVTDEYGCISSESETIDAITFDISLPSSESVCAGEDVFVECLVNGGTAPYHFDWSTDLPDANGVYYSPEENELITVEVTDAHGCVLTTDTMHLNVLQIPIYSVIASADSLCDNECMKFYLQCDSPLTSALWHYEGENFQGVDSVSLCPQTAGGMDVSGEIIFPNGCHSTFQTGDNIVVLDAPDVLLQTEFELLEDGTTEVNLQATTADLITRWDWKMDEVAYSNHQEDNLHIVVNPGSHNANLLVTSDNGCRAVTENSFKITDSFYIYIPNTFTPDADGVNDTWFPVIFGYYQNLRISVYNRYGENVFNGDEEHTHWTGGFKEYLVPDGIYDYIISFTDRQLMAKEYKGHVVVVR